MKRVFSILLAFVMLLGIVPVAAFAADSPVLSFSTTASESPKVGDEFTVTANLSSNPGLASVKLSLDWNSEVVEFQGFATVYDEEEEDYVLQTDILSNFTLVPNHVNGIITGARTKDNTKTGTLFVAKFKVIGNGNCEIGLKTGETEYMMKNASQGVVTINIDESAIENLAVTETQVGKYGLTINAENGTVTAKIGTTEVTEAAEGDIITLTPDPDDGYMLDTLTVMNGETPVEVTNNTFTMPAAAVTVSATFKAIPTGYTVTMGGDDEITAGETATIPVIVGYQSGAENAASTYNAFDMTFTYDATALTLTTAETEGMSITEDNGTVHIERYGSDKNVGEAAFNLTFTAKKTGAAEVKVAEAYVGISETAVREEAAKATILDDTAVVTVTVYNVTLPEEFKGETVADPENAYTFTAKDLNYNYTITAKIEGSESGLTVTGSGTEADPYTITADQITGNLVIATTKEGKKFAVSITENADMAPAEGFTTGENAAQYMTDYKAVLTPEDGYEYTVEIKIGSEIYECAPVENVYTIPGNKITGNITISVTKTEKSATPDPETEYDVTFQGSGKDDVAEGAAAKVKHGETYSFTLNKLDGYEYVVTATMGGTSVDITESETTNDDGTVTYSYAIADVSGALVITIEKSDLKVEVDEYVNLDGKTIFLVSATQTLAEGKALAYDGTVMFFKDYTSEDATDAWSYLVIVEKPAAEEGTEESQQTATLTIEDAAKMISVVDAETVTTLTQTYDVNEAGKVDINDAQLVYDMYNDVYEDFTKATMQKFLKADVNETRNIDVTDAAAIVTQIIANKQVAGN